MAWLISDNYNSINFFPHIFITTLSRKKFNTPIANLYKANYLIKNNIEYPDLTLIPGTANLVIQLFIPYSTEFDKIHNGERNLLINCFPAFLWDDLENMERTKIISIDLSLNENIKQNQKLTFSYTGIIKDN